MLNKTQKDKLGCPNLSIQLPVQKQLEKPLYPTPPRDRSLVSLFPLQQPDREHTPRAEAWIAFFPRWFLRICQVMCQSSAPSSLAGEPHEQSFRFQMRCHGFQASAFLYLMAPSFGCSSL